MNFLGIGVWEILLILAMALVILGPQDMGVLGRKAGKALRKWLSSDEYREIKRTQDALTNLPRRLMDEADLDGNIISPWVSPEKPGKESKAWQSKSPDLPAPSKPQKDTDGQADPLSAWANPGETREEKRKAMLESVQRSSAQTTLETVPDQSEPDQTQSQSESTQLS